MLELKVRKFGNSLGVVLPKEVIAHLDTREGAALFLTKTPEDGYRLSSYDPGFVKKLEKAQEVMQRYRDTLNALAK